ncbi:MAG: hypothetical protein CBC04_06900 [Verrucomicrobia bacterium TMED44]|nr:MAG: hypothetical protein CBC04_06900 [Verrucomicrobia bacterium TMED44]
MANGENSQLNHLLTKSFESFGNLSWWPLKVFDLVEEQTTGGHGREYKKGNIPSSFRIYY